MAHMVIPSKKEVERVLKINGFELVRVKGSHHIFTDKQGRHLTLKVRDVNPCIWRRVCKELNLVV